MAPVRPGPAAGDRGDSAPTCGWSPPSPTCVRSVRLRPSCGFRTRSSSAAWACAGPAQPDCWRGHNGIGHEHQGMGPGVSTGTRPGCGRNVIRTSASRTGTGPVPGERSRLRSSLGGRTPAPNCRRCRTRGRRRPGPRATAAACVVRLLLLLDEFLEVVQQVEVTDTGLDLIRQWAQIGGEAVVHGHTRSRRHRGPQAVAGEMVDTDHVQSERFARQLQVGLDYTGYRDR